MQNSTGGFGTYEQRRTSEWMELMNPADVFDRIMVEYDYPECTTAVLTSLSMFTSYYPLHRAEDIQKAITHAAKYIRRSQRPDGSWYGSWGICFTYATFFALQSLETFGEVYETSALVQKSCKWLLSKQKADGGWGEHWLSCETREYVEHEKSQVVHTAWAVLALMHARYPNRAPIAKGLEVCRFAP